MEKLKDFISAKKPHVIAVCAQDRDATQVVRDVQVIVEQLEQEEQIPTISVELVDSELATVFMNCNKGEVWTTSNCHSKKLFFIIVLNY